MNILFPPLPLPPAHAYAADPVIMAAFGGLGWLFFLCFFRIYCTNRFSSIFLRFLKGFGSQNGSRNRFFDHFFGCFFAPSFYINFLLFFLFFSMLETLKIVLPCRRENYFYKIDVFASSPKIDPKTIEIWVQNSVKI